MLVQSVRAQDGEVDIKVMAVEYPVNQVNLSNVNGVLVKRTVIQLNFRLRKNGKLTGYNFKSISNEQRKFD